MSFMAGDHHSNGRGGSHPQGSSDQCLNDSRYNGLGFDSRHCRFATGTRRPRLTERLTKGGY